MDIFNDILMYSNTEEIINFIRYFWHRNKYSVYNCLLIYAQRPGAVMLGTAKQWRSRNRFIKHETSPIVIVKPFGPVEFIYDYSDTYGDRELYPKRLTLSKSIDIQSWWINSLIDKLQCNGIFCTESNFGTRQGAELRILDHPRTYSHLSRNRKEKEIKTDCCITVNSMSDNGAKFTSVLHELGHLFCGHLPKGKYTPTNIKFPNRAKENLTKNQMEYEAEIAKNIVCEMLGVDLNDKEYYLMAYRNSDGSEPEVNYNEVLKAVDRILSIIPSEISNSVLSDDSFKQLTLFE